MSNHEFVVHYDDSFPREILRIPEETSIEILNLEDMERAITGISVNVRAFQYGQFEQLQIASSLVLRDSAPDMYGILAGFRDRIGQRELSRFEFDQHEDQGIVLAQFGTRGFNDGTTIITPVLDGMWWAVNSGLETFRHDPEIALADVETVVAQHSFALNALVGSISKVLEAEIDSETPPGAYELKMPSKEVELVITGPVDEFDKFVGIDPAVEELRNVVKLANMSPEVLEKHGIAPIQAVMLYGPSGLGKTELMRSLANALGAEIQPCTFENIGGRYVSDWATAINNVFEEAYRAESRVLIMFDELDGLINTGNRGVDQNVIAVLKQQLEKIKDYPHVFVAAATNDKSAINEAVQADKRFPLKIPFTLPNPNERASLFAAFLPEGALVSSIKPEDFTSPVAASTKLDFQVLADATEDFSPGDIVEVMNEVKKQILLRADDPEVELSAPTQEEILAAIQRKKQSRT